MEQRVIISRHLNTELTKALSECEHDRLFVLTDETTKNVCWPVMESFQVLKEAKMITIGDRSGWLCGFYLQAWHQFHQYPDDAARYGRCFRGR